MDSQIPNLVDDLTINHHIECFCPHCLKVNRGTKVVNHHLRSGFHWTCEICNETSTKKQVEEAIIKYKPKE